MKAIFIYNPVDLISMPPGGVQLCSEEFLNVVRSSADHVRLQAIQPSCKPLLRIRRKLMLGSYLGFDAASDESRLRQAFVNDLPTHVFLNRAELIRYSPILKKIAPDACVVVMSHGNQTGDDLYEIAGLHGSLGRASSPAAIWKLGLDLKTESWFRHRFVDAVCVMSEEEAVLERWLGARKVIIVPRIIEPRSVKWDPVMGRLGFAGTLDHTPNRVALEQLLPLLARLCPDVHVELVGGPRSAGLRFENAHTNVHYLGRLPGEQMVGVVSRWAVALNPVFWLSRGASMKLGQYLAWGLPTVSTTSGRRGYELPTGCFAQTEDCCESFADAVATLASNPEAVRALKRRLDRAQGQFITAAEIGQRVRTALSAG